MDYLEKALEQVEEWVRRLIEALLGGPDAEAEPELIPIPVDDRARSR